MSGRRASAAYRVLESVSDWVGHLPVIGPHWAAFWYQRLMVFPWIRKGWLVENGRSLRELRRTARRLA